jgi:hypothetical protein
MVNKAAIGGRCRAALLRAAIGPIWVGEDKRMPAIAPAFSTARPLVLVALLCGLILAATLGLWAYHGTAVFFEIVRSGWAVCF